MDASPESESAISIQGQLLRLSERREVWIYVRRGTLWVADFVDGNGELIEPETWFRFNCGSPGTPHARRRMFLESAFPLSPDVVAKIEDLHRGAAATPSDHSPEHPSSAPDAQPSLDHPISKETP